MSLKGEEARGKMGANETTDNLMKQFRLFLAGASEQCIIRNARTTAAALAVQKAQARSHHGRNSNQMSSFGHQSPIVIPPATISVKEILSSGLYLLRHLPVARDAVFDFMSNLINDAVRDYVSKIEGIPVYLTEEDIKQVEEIHDCLIKYLNTGGEIWAPILSQWTLQLLGQLSREYSNRSMFSSNHTVNEMIHVWMGCKAVCDLLDITSHCLSCIDRATTDAFISTLLDTSARHSPHFDWVVAQVGNTFPQTVVNEVLKLGLQNFSENSPQASKLSSVVGILTHLATTHCKEVQIAFDSMLQSGITDNNGITSKYAIPYLLHLCSTSVPLLDTLMDSALPKINEETLQRVRQVLPQWITLHFGGNEKALVALLTHLILKSNRGYKALQILMIGCNHWPQPIGYHTRVLLDHFVAEISSILYETEASLKETAKNFPFMISLRENIDIVLSFLTDYDHHVCRTAKQFIKLLAFQDNPYIGIKGVCYYLKFATLDKHLWHCFDLIQTLEFKYPNLLEESLKSLLVRHETDCSIVYQNLEAIDLLSKTICSFASTSGQNPKVTLSHSVSKDCHRIWKNIIRMIKTENIKDLKILRNTFSQVIHRNIHLLLPYFDTESRLFSFKEATFVVDIVSQVFLHSRKIRFITLLKLQKLLVRFFFKVLSIHENNPIDKIRHVAHISRALHKLCHKQPLQNDCLRGLVQSCLLPQSRKIFSPRLTITSVVDDDTMRSIHQMFDDVEEGDLDELNEELKPEKLSIYVSLMQENRKRNFSSTSSKAHSSSFHCGKLLKRGLKCNVINQKAKVIENEDADLNLKLFLSLLLCVSMKSGKDMPPKRLPKQPFPDVISIDAMKKVALLLVEIVAPDPLSNSMVWPDEEVAKTQIERDLQIKRAFDDHPYLWDMLQLIAKYCPALCHCSVLLRALMNILISYWTRMQSAKVTASPEQLSHTVKLMSLMKEGQFLPEPLNQVASVIPHLKASETVDILRDIWAYLKAVPPVPTVFVQSFNLEYNRLPNFCSVDSTYTEKLRLIILDNIETLGHLYPKFFPK